MSFFGKMAGRSPNKKDIRLDVFFYFVDDLKIFLNSFLEFLYCLGIAILYGVGDAVRYVFVYYLFAQTV